MLACTSANVFFFDRTIVDLYLKLRILGTQQHAAFRNSALQVTVGT